MARPSFKPTAAQRRQVAIAAGAGMVHEQIAIALGISSPTLRKHFGHELTVVAYQKRMEALVGIHAAAKRGSSSAAKAYLAVEPQLEAPPQESEPKPPAAPTSALAQPLGKKEQAQASAKTAADGTGWEGILPQPGTPLQ